MFVGTNEFVQSVQPSGLGHDRSNNNQKTKDVTNLSFIIFATVNGNSSEETLTLHYHIKDVGLEKLNKVKQVVANNISLDTHYPNTIDLNANLNLDILKQHVFKRFTCLEKEIRISIMIVLANRKR